MPEILKARAAATRVSFAARVVRWQQTHGRNDLPWQNTRDPYRVWLSEVMLQQTQVSTVRDYFARFLARFPDVHALAGAGEDEVLGLWSGLGYYSRARNLHRCAIEVVQRLGGHFPTDAQALETLPGIGRSTAAAIASLCFGARAAILDGNVKRVLTRHLGFAQDLAQAANARALWARAQQLLPVRDVQRAMPRYTQGLMDLGATVCLPSRPQCLLCPVSSDCVARAQGRPKDYPVKTRKLRRSAASLWLLLAWREDGAVWLHKRAASGVWAGLFCVPVFDSASAFDAAVGAARIDDLDVVVHALTHKDLYLHPRRWNVDARQALALEQQSHLPGAWHAADAWPGLGLPAPVRRLLEAQAARALRAQRESSSRCRLSVAQPVE